MDAGGCASCQRGRRADFADGIQPSFGRVHIGFYNAFLSVRNIVERHLTALLDSVYPSNKPVRIIVTGHSLGGALATMCVAWLIQWFRHVYPQGMPSTLRVLSVTFGQPKVGCEQFVQHVRGDPWFKQGRFKLYRLFTPLDPAPTVPPTSLGFRHCYDACSVAKGKMYAFPPEYQTRHENNSTMIAIKHAVSKGMKLLSFHDVFNYLSSVMQYADANRSADQDLDDIFGKVDFQADVLKKDFLRNF
jgi:hypothetical protein